MSEAEQNGRTVLFVSHNMDAMVRLCPTAVWLDAGRIRTRGPTEQLVVEYVRVTATNRPAVAYQDDASVPAQITGIALRDADGQPAATLTTRAASTLEVEIRVNEPVPGLDVGCLLRNMAGAALLDELMSDGPARSIAEPGRYRVRCTIPPVLPPGEYSIGVVLGTHYELIESREDAVAVAVEGDDLGRPQRLFKLGLPWAVERLTDDASRRAVE
jgi:hypothetical protein